MSCFESSTFLKNSSVMNAQILKKACDKLGWQYQFTQENGKDVLLITDANQGSELHGEYALKVVDNTVTYNSYYMRNGEALVKELESQFYELNVAYAKEAVLKAFEAVGFKYLPDNKFVPNEREKIRFKMVGHSRIKNETEKRTEIEFTILFDGTIVSDSNYIPEDVHQLADKAMESIDQAFGTKREEGKHIKRKPIPLKYKNKAYCAANNKIIAKH